jgi:hypothetical protein
MANESSGNAPGPVNAAGPVDADGKVNVSGACNAFRGSLLACEKTVRMMVFAGVVRGEAAEQAMLAVRHLEDARMRLGKVIQYTEGGGVSCWDSDRKPADDGR